MALENTVIQDKLTAAFGENVLHFKQEKDMFSFEIPTNYSDCSQKMTLTAF
jgi:NADH-quinone oxidoreductase subunit C